MSYQVEFKKSASKALDGIPVYDRQRILEAIVGLKTNPRPAGCKKLSGREGWRIRSQNYRVIYDIDDTAKRVLIQVIGNRRDVYRR
ncbi:MAG TPA: type II toxin-antitoxin system RelE/ParE family toxin [Candidatus Methylacidiphilales bacterium]|nr:type II toxin-antitoxin system RelE/ParE family toxin [Candidatus Methylacidiphilales bacterium]